MKDFFAKARDAMIFRHKLSYPDSSDGYIGSLSAANYKLQLSQCLDEQNDIQFGYEKAKELLIDCGADKDKIQDVWIKNHYRWIVWKLSCYDLHYGI